MSTEVAGELGDAAAAARAAGRRIPDFFIVGHAKCGTTALCEMLRTHPQIFISELKEPWFFARDNPQPQTSDVRSVAFTGRYKGSLEEYLRLFEDAREDQRAGEGSTSYLWSPSAASRIAQVQPAARIIAILREPASFLRSLHLQLLQRHVESEKDFRKAVELDAARLEGREIPISAYWPGALIYSNRVRYVEQLSRYRDHFSAAQMLVLIYDDFRADNVGTVREVMRFLEVDDTHPVRPLEANPTVGTSVRVHRLRRALGAGGGPVGRAIRGTGRTLSTGAMRRRVYHQMLGRLEHGSTPAPDEAFMLELRRRFKPEVVAAGEYLGRDLVSLWGYDKLP